MNKGTTFQIVNAQVITPSGAVENCGIRVEDGMITAVGPDINADMTSPPPGRDSAGTCSRAPCMDAHGAQVWPGFIDLHSDAIEKEIETRPGSCLPVEMAVAELDKKMAAAGVTTIFHSISFAEKEYAILRTMDMAEQIIKEVKAMARFLSVNTGIHLRYEITNTESLPVVEGLIQDGLVDLVSIMDHTPGQGQFKTVDQFKKYYSAYFSRDEGEVVRIMDKRREIKAGVGLDNACRIAEICRAHGVPLASHDDDTVEKIDFVQASGAVVSEFPVTREAARHARQKGLMVAVGSPNIVRGGSHNNNLSALELIREGLADIVCSDYVPSTLLHALFRIQEKNALAPHLAPHLAARLFSANPAQAMGIGTEVGELIPGRRADMLVVDHSLTYPRILKTYVQGREAYSSCIGWE